MILFDATHTSHTTAQTGIQRVCRSLYAALNQAPEVSGICFDPHLDAWRPLSSTELGVLNDRSAKAGASRGSRWSLAQMISGHARRLTDSRSPLPETRGFICPELFSAKVGARLPELLQVVTGPRIAIFHDAIPLKFPELTAVGNVARFPAYLRELLLFDGVAAVSADSAASLRDYWRWLGVDNAPPVHAIPLGLDRPIASGVGATKLQGSAFPRILSVGTIEGRKNHLALLEACETLWREGLVFELEMIGLARPDTAAPALEKMAALRAMGRPLVFHGSASEASLHKAYARASFTVYPSIIEGFGLPVLESLQHGKPCVCSGRGALGESARGGGCVALDSVDTSSLVAAIRRLLSNSSELAQLAVVAQQRKFKTWTEYADEMKAWMHSLPRRD